MFDENQLVEMKWNNGTKSWYESKGYVFTGKNDIFYVKAKDLKPTSAKYVDVVCDYCGRNYRAQYYTVIAGMKTISKNCCINCRNKKGHEIWDADRIQSRFSRIENICNERGYKLVTTVDEYVNGSTYIEYICPKHGLQKIKANNLCDGSGCLECRLERLSDAQRLDSEEVEQRIESVNGNKLLNPEDYIGNNVANLRIMCSCGNVYTTSLAAYMFNNTTRCPRCSNSESKAERRIKEFFENHDILFKQEYGFDECRDIHRMPFDFYLPDYNICIEYQGKQHYEPIEYFGGEAKFIVRQKHDNIKRKYCNDNGILLIEIPYWNENNIEEILKDKLCL